MAFDLGKIYNAGILPMDGRDVFKSTVSASSFVEKASNFLTCFMVADSESEAVLLFQKLENL